MTWAGLAVRHAWTDTQIICTVLAVRAAAIVLATSGQRGTLPLFVWSTLGFLAARRRERIPHAVVVQTRARHGS
jgi:hypothetical protein